MAIETPLAPGLDTAVPELNMETTPLLPRLQRNTPAAGSAQGITCYLLNVSFSIKKNTHLFHIEGALKYFKIGTFCIYL